MNASNLKKLIVEEIRNIQNSPIFRHQALTMDYDEQENEIVLNSLKVVEQFRGRGIGTKAIQSLIKFAQSKNKPIVVDWATGDFDGKDTQIKRFFEKNGFVVSNNKLVKKP